MPSHRARCPVLTPPAELNAPIATRSPLGSTASLVAAASSPPPSGDQLAPSQRPMLLTATQPIEDTLRAVTIRSPSVITTRQPRAPTSGATAPVGIAVHELPFQRARPLEEFVTNRSPFGAAAIDLGEGDCPIGSQLVPSKRAM